MDVVATKIQPNTPEFPGLYLIFLRAKPLIHLDRDPKKDIIDPTILLLILHFEGIVICHFINVVGQI